jgi:hypothetical protein
MVCPIQTEMTDHPECYGLIANDNNQFSNQKHRTPGATDTRGEASTPSSLGSVDSFHRWYLGMEKQVRRFGRKYSAQQGKTLLFFFKRMSRDIVDKGDFQQRTTKTTKVGVSPTLRSFLQRIEGPRSENH